MRDLALSSALVAIFFTGVSIGILEVGSAQVRSSSNYQLQSDSINIGGGLGTSSNFTQESTLGEVATGRSTSSNYQLRAGYQQMQEVFLSMTAAADVVMSPDLPGITGGTSNGTTSVVVTTDSPSGYQLTIVAADSPALRDGANTIDDYPETASSPSVLFNVSSGEAYFGYSPSGDDIPQAFQDAGGIACNVGSDDTYLACWAGLSTSSEIVAESTSANQPSGATTTIHFRVGLGGSNSVASGVYTATTTLTALPL